MQEVHNSLAEALVDRYRIDREIGRGAMATVYLARDLRHDREVALKTLSTELSSTLAADRFLAEIRIASRLSHPNVVPLYDSGSAGGLLWYTMPFIAGESLRSKLARDGRLPVREAAEIGRELADALDYAHRQGVVHRDIKPENVLLHQGHAVLADFGVARALTESANQRLTLTGMSIGTPAYMSPEQAAGETNLDGRSDVYSLGCVVYELLAGSPPFSGESAASVIARRFSVAAPSLRTQRSEISETLERVVAGAMTLEPELRFQTAGAFAEALGDSIDSQREVTQRSIAVLPFANLSPDPDNEYFSDGLTGEVIADLSRIRALRVVSRTTSMRFKGTTDSMRTVGRRLDVRYILEGSVRKSGSNLRITAQLVDATTDSQLWGQKYSGTLDDVFDLQERVARSIVNALDVKLSSEEERKLGDRPISDATAFDLSLRARKEIEKLQGAAIDRAIAFLNEALKSEPNNSTLHALLGYAEVNRLKTGVRADLALPRAEAEVKRAFELSPNLSYAFLVRGLTRFERGDLQQAVHDFKESLKSEPTNFDAQFYLGLSYVYTGKLDAAKAVSDLLLRSDPHASYAHLLASVIDWMDGKFPTAISRIERARELDPDSTIARWLEGYALALDGQLDKALLRASELVDRDPKSPYTLQLVALMAAMRGDRERAVETLQPFSQVPLDAHISFHHAEAFAVAGAPERAANLLDRAVDMGFHPYWFLARYDPLLNSLRGHQRFIRLLERAKEKWETFEV